MLGYQAKNYAQALVELAIKRDKLERQLENCHQLLRTIADNPKLLRGFRSAFVSKEEKLTILEMFRPYLDSDLFALITILISRNSPDMLVKILEDFILLAHSHLGIVEGRVLSAVSLSEERLKSLEVAVGRRMNKVVRLTNTIDKSLLAGLRVEVANHVIELSFNSLLEEARELLLRGRGGRRWL